MVDFLDLDIAWGGYYAGVSNGSDEVSVFRLLDFNRDACHISIYSEKYESVPSADEVRSLSSFIGHAPMHSQALFNYEFIELIATEPLSPDDLFGYRHYLDNFGASDEEIDEFMQSLISYSQEPPMKLRLSVVEDELQLFERQ